MEDVGVLVSLYVDYLRDRTENTRRAYAADIRDLAQGLNGDFGEEHVRELERRIRDLSCAPSTRNRKSSAVKQFIDFVNGHLGLELRVDLGNPKLNALMTQPTRPSDYQILVNTALGGKTGERDHALLALMYLQGLRPAEISALMCKDVGEAILTVDRDIFELEPACVPVLRAYEGTLISEDRKTHMAYFQNRSHKGLGVRSVRKRVENLAETTGIEATPRSLRWGYIKNLIDSGMNNEDVCVKARVTPQRMAIVYKGLFGSKS